jgi:lipopolysaccharide export system protein LptC
MIHRSYFSFTFILLVGLFALTVWLDKVTQPLSMAPELDFYQQPDYVIERTSGLRVEHEKNIRRVFYANKTFHYINQDLTQLESIQFINSEVGKPPFRVFADHAELRNHGEDIFLNGNVTVIRGLDGDKAKITLKTDKLHLLPSENKVKTDKSVMISRLNTTIHAVGLELNNQTGIVELLSRVRAVDQKP